MTARGRLIIVGAGGLGLEALWVARAMNAAETASWEILGFADDRPERVGGEHYGVPIVSTSSDIAQRFGRDVHLHLAIGNNQERARLAEAGAEQGLAAATLVHPRAETAQGVLLGEGSYVGPFATLAPQCVVGSHVIVNIRAVVGHEARVGDFAQIGPGAVLTGGCVLGDGVFVGSNASLYPGRRMDNFSTAGSNSFIVNDVPAKETVMGVPARPVFRRR